MPADDKRLKVERVEYPSPSGYSTPWYSCSNTIEAFSAIGAVKAHVQHQEATMRAQQAAGPDA